MNFNKDFPKIKYEYFNFVGNHSIHIRIIFLIIYICFGCYFISNVNYADSILNSTTQNIIFLMLQSFVLNAPLPVSGPPIFFPITIILYFVSPVVAFESIVTVIKEILTTFKSRIESRIVSQNTFNEFKDHIIVAGLGKLGISIARLLKSQGRIVVGVDIDNSANNQLNLNDFICADFASGTDVINRFNIQKALLYLALSGNDFANIESAENIRQIIPDEKLKIIIQISDIFVFNAFFPQLKKQNVLPFNIYDIVSRNIINQINEESKDLNKLSVIIAGFGNLGKLILYNAKKILVDMNNKEVDFFIIDKNTEIKHDCESFSNILNLEGLNVDVRNNDVMDKSEWFNLFNNESLNSNSTKLILCTDNDSKNISTAVFLNKLILEKDIKIKIVSRFFRKPLFLNSVFNEHNIDSFTFEDKVSAYFNNLLDRKTVK